MIRLLIVGLVGYAFYRAGRHLVESVPDDFEPVGLLPPPQATPKRAQRKAG